MVVAPVSLLKSDPFLQIHSRLGNRSKFQGLFLRESKIHCSRRHNLKNGVDGCKRGKTLVRSSCFVTPDEIMPKINAVSVEGKEFGKRNGIFEVGNQEFLGFCGFGYYMNGFRGFPWLALNFHMAHALNMHPSALQIVQYSGNLPMVAKPLYGILSDALCIGGARRIPYVAIGVFLQIISWGSLALIPRASEGRAALMAFVILSNLGASIAEVAKDALVAEYGQANNAPGLQSYAFMASAMGGILGNLIGGFFLLKTQQTKSMFLAFAALLLLQLTFSLKTNEKSLNLPRPSSNSAARKSIPQSIKTQVSDLMVAIKEGVILRPLVWVVSSILLIPSLSGSIFCYQTQFLNLDPSVIGLSKVTGQLMLLSLAVLYDRFGKDMPLRKLTGIVQILFAFSLLLDLALVKQLNIQLGIPNDIYTLCFSGLSETIAQFKLLPFYVLFASLAPQGCEGSLLSFLASGLCLSSTVGGFLGVGLASFLGITSGNYSLLPLGIVIQFLAALMPLHWIDLVSMSLNVREKVRNACRSKKTRRNRRVGRVLFDSVYSYRRQRESDLQR